MMKTIVHPLADKVGAKMVIIADTNWDDVPAPFKGLRRSKAMTWHSGDNCGDATEGWVCENDGECVNDICEAAPAKNGLRRSNAMTWRIGDNCGDATEGWVCENDGKCVNDICEAAPAKNGLRRSNAMTWRICDNCGDATEG